MKRFLLLTCLFCIANVSIFGQTDVALNIFHKFGNDNFEFFSPSENNLGHSFNLKRLEYYISQISLVHDGGTETAIEDLYILVNAEATTSVELGNYNINEVEAIRFFIGVDSLNNHADPALFIDPHPLAPQFPSMHWGWSAGYRFVALEGKSGPELNQECQIHALGDQNYFQTEVMVNFIAEDGNLSINLNADYNRVLEEIPLEGGVFNHGFDDEAATAIENFRDYVFSESNETTSAIDFSEVSKFEVFPNPAIGKTRIILESTKELNYRIAVSDILGKQIISFDEVPNHAVIDITLDHAGVYFIQLIKEGQTVITRKLLSN